jgi:hypothetical protein
MSILTPVVSSNIKAVGYDPGTKELTVQFRSGSTYRYDGVPATTYADLIDADSIGSFFHSNVRNAFVGTPLDDEE